MKNALLLLRLLVILLCFSTACGDKEDGPRPVSRTDLLTAKTWKMSKVLMDGVNITNDPAAAQFKNMQVKFQADGKYTLTTLTGAVTGTWAFADKETKLVFDPDTASETTWDILELNDSSAKTSFRTLNPILGTTVVISFELVNN